MGKFYWLKLPRGFFKRHDMMILESMEDGQILENLFLKLLTESIDHDGELRFSESIPYTPKMLATICRTDEETMTRALMIFEQLELIEVDDQNTISIPMAKKMIGSAEDNDAANRQRRRREAMKITCDNSVTKCHADVTEERDKDVTKCHKVCDKKSLEKEIEKEKEIELDIEKEKREKKKADEASSATLSPSPSRTRFIPPTVEEVKAYCEERHNGIDGQVFCDFYASKNWMVGKSKMKDWRAAVRTWESRRRDEPKASRKPDEIPTMNDIMTEERTGTWDGVSYLEGWERQRLSDSERQRYDDWCWEHALD